MKINFFKYKFTDSGEINFYIGKEPPVMTTRKELKKNRKINFSAFKKNLGRLQKNRAKAGNP